MDSKELEKLGAATLADIICSEITVLNSKIKELQEKIKEYDGLEDKDSSYMQMAYGFKLTECEGARDRLLMFAGIERDRQAKEQKRRNKKRVDYEQMIVLNIFKDGKNIDRTSVGIGTAKSFTLAEELYLPDECTVEIHAFDDPEEAERYTRDL